MEDMQDMQRSLGGDVAVSQARIFDPANVKVANYDELAVADFSNVQYLQVSESEHEAEDYYDDEEDEEDNGNEREQGAAGDQPRNGKKNKSSSSAGNAGGSDNATTATTTPQKRKKDKRKNRKGKAGDDSGTYYGCKTHCFCEA